MHRLVFALVMVLGSAGFAFAQDQGDDLENLLYMDLKDGRVVIKMYPAFAPETVKRVKTLTREGFYDGLTFHRVLEGFMAQTGDPRGDGTGGSKYPDLPDEFNIKRHWRGTLSMANASVPNSANSQFFIMFQDGPALDNKYTIWGRVRSGMRYVDAIKQGDQYQDGLVIGEPDKIIKMQIAADVETTASEAEVVAGSVTGEEMPGDEEAVEEDATAEDVVEEEVATEDVAEEDVTAEDAVEEEVAAEDVVEEDE